ncbi:hypothetical protein [Paralcaligenes ureilyticus]|uniref:Uncharacterized protein n=1 Tax=Paralcaligenes ureilyticus TaxID=627131 RepID=A0A4R3LWP9_9BURK|nr:hypothetical protein [Paralcaligenes ureilyticus]TCT03095.1 hypothetical protein EDC26_11662 [Paralcaligenes ureilyticus]
MKIIAPLLVLALGVAAFIRLYNKPTTAKAFKKSSWDEWFALPGVSPDFMDEREQPRPVE